MLTLSTGLTTMGLVFDIVGFWILLWDLLPKYLQDREALRMKRGMDLIDMLKDTDIGEEYTRQVSKIIEFMNDSQFPYSQWLQFDRRRWRRKNRIFSDQFLAETYRLIAHRRDQALQRSNDIEDSRRRSPVIWGGALVSLGFIGQLCGSLATMMK